MVAVLRDRLEHIAQSIDSIFALLDGLDLATLKQRPDTRAAFERYLEIVSEASRHIPEAIRRDYGAAIPWRGVADLGNVLRHAYHLTDVDILWQIYERDLPPLSDCIRAMLADPVIE